MSFIDDLLGSELNLLFFISVAVWILIFVYLLYLDNKFRALKRELDTLKDD
jgi:CcmD family protein